MRARAHTHTHTQIWIYPNTHAPNSLPCWRWCGVVVGKAACQQLGQCNMQRVDRTMDTQLSASLEPAHCPGQTPAQSSTRFIFLNCKLWCENIFFIFLILAKWHTDRKTGRLEERENDRDKARQRMWQRERDSLSNRYREPEIWDRKWDCTAVISTLFHHQQLAGRRWTTLQTGLGRWERKGRGAAE